jgi:hypothetical protein
MNFRQLKDRLRIALKNPGVEDDPDLDLGGYINSGYVDVASRYPYHQTRKRSSFVTVAGSQKYELPCDLTVIRRLMDVGNGRKLVKTGDRYLASRRNDYNSRPSRYIRYRNYVELIPTPDAVYTIEIWYDALPCLLIEDVDEPVLPESWHPGIILRAKWYYWMDKGDQAQVSHALNNYSIWLSDKPSEIEEETVDLDAGVEVPTLARGYGYGLAHSRFDDGGFDFRDGR